MTIQQKRVAWHNWWKSLTDDQRAVYRHKANWERMSLSAVAKEWPVTAEEAAKIMGAHPRRTGKGER